MSTPGVVNETAATNGTDTFKATTEAVLTAYASLVGMALLPILVGSFRSVAYLKKQKESAEKPEAMTSKDAAMFPITASCALFALYVFFKVFSKEYVNLLLSAYFLVLGVLALTQVLRPIVNRLLPGSYPVIPYHLIFTKGKDNEKESLIDLEFDSRDYVTLAISTAFGVWYLFKKHWLANNLFGLAFAVEGIELLQLNTVTVGCILLGGLFFYDIFWVFGTDVMITVAKSFDAPIKLVFPQDFLVNGVFGTKMAMLGLGDIVIPGIFIALLLRFDVSLKRKANVYFWTSFVAYILGLVICMAILAYYKHGQPALLYLVPLCIGLPLFVALVRGDIKPMFSYEDHPSIKEQGDKDKKEASKKVK